MANEEEILLAFKESGVEFVEEASKAVGELGEKFTDVNTSAQAAIEVLKEESTVVEDLREKIAAQKRELEALADAHKAGVIGQSKYKEQTDAVISSLRENETVLKRLTAAESEAAAKEEAEAAAVETLDKAFEKLAVAEAEAAAQAERMQAAAGEQQIAFASMTAAAERATGFGEGEEGKGGLAGVAAGVMKAERAAVGLATGHGIRGATTALEGLAMALGGPAGIGLAIGGLVTFIDIVLPKLHLLTEAMIGITEETKAASEALKEQDKAAKKREEEVGKLGEKLSPEDEEKAKLVQEATEGKAAEHLQYGITHAMEIQGEGGATRQQVAHATAEATNIFGQIDEAALKKSLKAAAGKNRVDEANRLILEAPHSKKARDRLREIAMNHPDLFPPDFIELLRDIEETREEREAAEATIDEEEAERQGRKKARFEKAKELNKQDKERAVAAKDHIGDLKTELSDLGLDLREKKITPQEYQAKAGELVDAIAKAVQDLAKIPGEEVKAARRDIDAAKRQVRTTFDAGVTAMHRAADKAAHDAKTAADKAHRDAERRARENTPEHQLHEQIAADRYIEAGTAQLLDRMHQERGGVPATPEFLQGVLSAAARRRAMTGRSAAQSVLDVLGIALDQYDMQWNAEFARGLNSVMRGAGQQNRPQQNVVPFGGI